MGQYIRSVLYGQPQVVAVTGDGIINTTEDLFKFSKIEGDLTKGAGKANSVNPNEIRFSQSCVNGSEEIIQSMKINGLNGDPIDVLRMSEGKLTTIDNTRVVSAREARIEVQANIHDANELLPESLMEGYAEFNLHLRRRNDIPFIVELKKMNYQK